MYINEKCFSFDEVSDSVVAIKREQAGSTALPSLSLHQVESNRPLSFPYTNLSVRSKQDEKYSLIASTDSDVIVLTETWLSSSIIDMEIFPNVSGYNMFRRDRTCGREGGVRIAIKDSFVFLKTTTTLSRGKQWEPAGTTEGKVVTIPYLR